MASVVGTRWPVAVVVLVIASGIAATGAAAGLGPASSLDGPEDGRTVDVQRTDRSVGVERAEANGTDGGDGTVDAELAAVNGTDGFAADAAPGIRDATEPPSEASATIDPSGGRASVTGDATAVANPVTNLTVTQELDLTPDEPGSVAVTVRYDAPGRLTTLRTEVPSDATVTGTSGFSRSEGRTYEWDGETGSPSVTYALAVNETRDLAGPEGGPGEHLFVDAGEWALFRRPAMGTTWGWTGGEPIGLSRESTTVGPGFVGDWIVYVGEYETHERRAHGQRFTLVVPERATLTESPGEILDSLATASDQLRVGDRDDRVTAVAAPTTDIEWGVRGLQFGEADMWVRDVEALDSVENTWLHEYVHTRQDYQTAANARWTTEAMATYYAALLSVEQDRADLSNFGPFLGRGALAPQSGAVLSQPSTWANAANYWKGGLVAGDVDRRIREATDRERSLQAVFSRLNAHPGTVDRGTVESTVGEYGGETVREALFRFSTTPAHPAVWSRATHERVFGTTPARVSVLYSDAADAFTVSGPYRNETLDSRWRVGQEVEGPKLSMYEGETVTARATVANAGDAPTEYEARFAVDDRILDSRTGSLRPGEAATHSFDRTFEERGTYVLAVGSDEVAVEVYEPARANVTALRANRTSLSGPGAVELTATVRNEHAAPARSNLSLAVDGAAVFDRTVSLGANAEREISSTVRLTERGEYTIQLGEADDLTISVGGSGGENGGGGSSTFGPGFGGVAAVAALIGGAALFARRRS